MSTAPDPGMTCPYCGRVFATFGNVTNMPCTACAYRRLDAQAARIARLEKALDELFVLTSHSPDPRVQKANDIIEALSHASDGTAI